MYKVRGYAAEQGLYAARYWEFACASKTMPAELPKGVAVTVGVSVGVSVGINVGTSVGEGVSTGNGVGVSVGSSISGVSVSSGGTYGSGVTGG